VTKVRTPLLLIVLGLVAALATSCSSSPGASSTSTSAAAAATTTTAAVAIGAITCTGITGALTFSPPLTTKGAAAESTAINLKASGCTTAGSTGPAVTAGTGSATISSATSSCTGLLTPRALTINITWSPSTIRPSVLTFSGYSAAMNSAGDEGFTLPTSGGTAKVTGSFAGSDLGATSTAQTFSNQTGTQLLASCGSSAGLASLQVTSGTLALK
jgi:hypothetical protein